jgi:predicted regulator of Ras-like GTPase activity (Roadblock/LC7/MglB family)
MIEKIVKNVLELPGVEGACILDKKGVLLHNDLPDFFLEDFLDDLARRIKTLYEAVDENYMACDDYLLKFPEKYIRLRRSRNVFLLVVVDPSVNMVSLKMVTNIVLKHITPKVLSEMRKILQAAKEEAPVADSPAPAEAPAPVPPPAATAEAPAAKPSPSAPVRGERVPRPRPSRSFRGTRY